MFAINDRVQRVFGLSGKANLGVPDSTIATVGAIRLLESNRTRCELSGCRAVIETGPVNCLYAASGVAIAS